LRRAGLGSRVDEPLKRLVGSSLPSGSVATLQGAAGTGHDLLTDNLVRVSGEPCDVVQPRRGGLEPFPVRPVTPEPGVQVALEGRGVVRAEGRAAFSIVAISSMLIVGRFPFSGVDPIVSFGETRRLKIRVSVVRIRPQAPPSFH
jgi:hypothetical protein